MFRPRSSARQRPSIVPLRLCAGAFLFLLALVVLVRPVHGQAPERSVAPETPVWDRTQVFVNASATFVNLDGGGALLEARDAREAVGSYGSQTGWAVGFGFYRPVGAVEGLLLGAAFKATLTGSEPDAGYAEGYFFNPLLIAASAKHYPLRSGALSQGFVRLDLGVSSISEKRRFVDEAGAQAFLHQFGIGVGGLLGVGFDVAAGPVTLVPAVTYEYHRTRVEVSGIGDDVWRYGVLSVGAGVRF